MVKFGLEIEFLNYDYDNYLYDPTVYDLFEGWLHTREYYQGMQEIISPPFKFNKKNVYQAIREGMRIIKRTSYESGCKSLLYSKPIYKYDGVISAGVHIHLSFSKKEGNMIGKLYSYIPTEAMYRIIKEYEQIFGWGIRSKLSHHIWGALRSYNYSFKQKDRFLPVALSPRKARKPLTVEIRLLDLEDILKPAKVYRFLKNSIEILRTNLDVKNHIKYNDKLYKDYVFPYNNIDSEDEGYENVDDIISQEGLYKKSNNAFYFKDGRLRRLR